MLRDSGGVTGLRLDWNESPFGPPAAAVARVLANARDLHRYPRGLLEAVTEAVALDNGVEPESVLLTNGVDEAIDLALLSVDTCWFVTPGFDAYADRARVLGRTARPIPLDASWRPALRPAELAEAGGAVFLAQPHNPTGQLFPAEWTDEVISRAELVFLDTTYADFSSRPASLAHPEPRDAARHPRLLMFRSFSKGHGLAGVRLGALIGAPRLLTRLRSRQRFHSVDSVALHAVAGALADPDHRARLRAHILAERPHYVAELATQPIFTEVRDTHTNFVVARCREDLSSAEVVKRLAEHDVWVRDGGPLGLPGWLRITVGTSDDLLRLAGALTTIDR